MGILLWGKTDRYRYDGHKQRSRMRVIQQGNGPCNTLKQAYHILIEAAFPSYRIYVLASVTGKWRRD